MEIHDEIYEEARRQLQDFKKDFTDCESYFKSNFLGKLPDSIYPEKIESNDTILDPINWVKDILDERETLVENNYRNLLIKLDQGISNKYYLRYHLDNIVSIVNYIYNQIWELKLKQAEFRVQGIQGEQNLAAEEIWDEWTSHGFGEREEYRSELESREREIDSKAIQQWRQVREYVVAERSYLSMGMFQWSKFLGEVGKPTLEKKTRAALINEFTYNIWKRRKELQDKYPKAYIALYSTLDFFWHFAGSPDQLYLRSAVLEKKTNSYTMDTAFESEPIEAIIKRPNVEKLLEKANEDLKKNDETEFKKSLLKIKKSFENDSDFPLPVDLVLSSSLSDQIEGRDKMDEGIKKISNDITSEKITHTNFFKKTEEIWEASVALINSGMLIPKIVDDLEHDRKIASNLVKIGEDFEKLDETLNDIKPTGIPKKIGKYLKKMRRVTFAVDLYYNKLKNSEGNPDPKKLLESVRTIIPSKLIPAYNTIGSELVEENIKWTHDGVRLATEAIEGVGLIISGDPRGNEIINDVAKKMKKWKRGPYDKKTIEKIALSSVTNAPVAGGIFKFFGSLFD